MESKVLELKAEILKALAQPTRLTTLVEVPMARTFLDLGMGRGPLLAYLLADPVISLPSILVISKLIGLKRLFVYVGLIIFFCTLAGLIYGFALTIL